MAVNALTLPCFAKINLYLEVVGKRADGFHELVTVFQTVSLADELRIEKIDGDEIVFECDDSSLPNDESNIVVKAALLLRKRFNATHGARLKLVKNIPSPGGLGGGSSDAAVTLLGLNRLWAINAEIKDLHPLAAELGSDVPFFLYGGTALGRGRGTDIEVLPDAMNSGLSHLLIVTPRVDILTAKIFGSLNAPNLTNIDSETNLIVCHRLLEKAGNGLTVLKNDLESHVIAAYNEVGKVIDTLTDLKASQVLLSGSGASVFGLFEKEETRQAALKALDKYINWRKFVVATITGDEYRQALNLVF